MEKVSQFLKRINYEEKPKIDLESLSKLQTSFLKSVPFENLDIINNTPLDYSSKNIFHKIVIQNRGGLCYENNGLFHDMLTELGFDVYFIIAAMFPKEEKKFDFSHMALIVTLNDIAYLIDVGNGKSFGNPLTIHTVSISQSEGILATLKPYNNDYYGLYYLIENIWSIRYIFNMNKKTRADFKQACHFIESSPKSPFTQNKLVSMLFDTKRITLSDTGLSSTVFKEKSIKNIISDDEYLNILKNTFNITL